MHSYTQDLMGLMGHGRPTLQLHAAEVEAHRTALAFVAGHEVPAAGGQPISPPLAGGGAHNAVKPGDAVLEGQQRLCVAARRLRLGWTCTAQQPVTGLPMWSQWLASLRPSSRAAGKMRVQVCQQRPHALCLELHIVESLLQAAAHVDIRMYV